MRTPKGGPLLSKHPRGVSREFGAFDRSLKSIFLPDKDCILISVSLTLTRQEIWWHACETCLALWQAALILGLV